MKNITYEEFKAIEKIAAGNTKKMNELLSCAEKGRDQKVILVLKKPEECRRLRIPSRRFLDLMITYYNILGDGKLRLIDNAEMEWLDLTEEELYANAIKNSVEYYQPIMYRFSDRFPQVPTFTNPRILSGKVEEYSSSIVAIPSVLEKIGKENRRRLLHCPDRQGCMFYCGRK